MTEATDEIRAALAEMGLARADASYPMTPLGGGVSCDVFAVDLPSRRIVVKRALPKLRVVADWRAPPKRSETEVAWFKLVANIDRRWTPNILGEDRARHAFAMEFYPYPVWKWELAIGEINPDFAAKVGRTLARIHAVSTEGFDNFAQFRALRIEPYLLYTADRHPDVAARIRAIADSVAGARIAVMHGDISPKNILVGPEEPMFLDAETACVGDPAFDLAFCLNHLLLKSVWHPRHAEALSRSFAALKDGYAPDTAMERRTAALLAALLLARIDGKSPVEYLTDERQKEFLRTRAKSLLKDTPPLDHFASAISR